MKQPHVYNGAGGWFIDGKPIYDGEQDGEPGMAYVDPCGAAPDGLWFRIEEVKRLIAQEVIWPNWRDDRPEEAIGFQIVGQTESDEEARNLQIIIDTAGGH